VLMALARLISAGEPGTRGAIAGLLGEYGLRIDPAKVSEVARRLVQMLLHLTWNWASVARRA